MRKNQDFGGRRVYVIIAAYNCQKWLEASIASVLAQKNINVQVVVVDDGSTDKASQMIDSMANKNKRIHALHKVNGGVSSARNQGIQYVLSISRDGDYIAFLDADDAWTQNFFDQTILDIIDKEADLIGFQSAVCNNELTMRAQTVNLTEGQFMGGNKSVWIHATQSFGAMIYLCRFLKKYHVRFMENLRYSEDKIFSMQCMYLAHHIILKNKLLYLYRKNETSAISRRRFGIPYFVPIIDGYLESDSQMLKYQDTDRGRLDQGHTMAMAYIMDMLEEHYQQFGHTDQVKELFENKPIYREIYEEGLKQKEKRYQEYHTRRIWFIIRNYMRGIQKLLARQAMKIKIINRFRQAKLYNIAIVKL